MNELFALALSYLGDVKYHPQKEAGEDSLQQQYLGGLSITI
jgi:hypothetical protein